MAIELEIWSSSIQEKLKEDNSFLNHISDVDESNVLAGKVVHIPQAGEPSKVVKNRTTFPAEVKMRKDDEVLYSIDTYTTDPVHIPHVDTVELSYDKRRSVLDQDIENLSEETAEGMLINIVVSPVGTHKELPKKNILVTSGDIAAGTLGSRKSYKLNDLQKMRNFFRTQKAWSEDNMYALITPEAETQMFPADSMVTATYMAQVSERERREGVMYKFQGWKIMVRSTVYIMNSTNKDFKAYGAIAEDTDTEGCLFWNKKLLEKTFGTTEIFERISDPQYYGDIYSFLVRVGGRAKRKNFEGVGVLMQAAG